MGPGWWVVGGRGRVLLRSSLLFWLGLSSRCVVTGEISSSQQAPRTQAGLGRRTEATWAREKKGKKERDGQTESREEEEDRRRPKRSEEGEECG